MLEREGTFVVVIHGMEKELSVSAHSEKRGRKQGQCIVWGRGEIRRSLQDKQKRKRCADTFHLKR